MILSLRNTQSATVAYVHDGQPKLTPITPKARQTSDEVTRQAGLAHKKPPVDGTLRINPASFYGWTGLCRSTHNTVDAEP